MPACWMKFTRRAHVCVKRCNVTAALLMENYVNRSLYDKSIKFCIVVYVVRDLTNDIIYNSMLNRSKFCYFGVKK